jgi:hypothetical protein
VLCGVSEEGVLGWRRRTGKIVGKGTTFTEDQGPEGTVGSHMAGRKE